MPFLESHPAFAIAAIITLGVAAQWIAWRINLPAILPLLLIGFFIGPVLGWLEPAAIFGEELLFSGVSLAVGLILFEGGLTLRLPELKQTRGVVLRLVTVGALITWLGGTVAAMLLTDLSLPLAFLFGALIIVTGPTVIGPLLRIVRPNDRVANVLKWEGILIDAVGALAAVLVFEFLVIENRQQALGETVLLLLRFILVGAVTGFVGGGLLAWLLRRRLLPDYLVNVGALALVFAFFEVSNLLAPESGLLATVLMGVVVANVGVPNIQDLLSFKEDLTILFISLLFIVLAANIHLDALLAVIGWRSLLLLALVMLVLRPLDIMASTIGSPLSRNEKLYLSWIAPRGIVAASVSSLFAAELTTMGFAGAELLAPLVFLIIVGTVLLNSLTAKPIAQLLGVAEPDPQGFLILGAHPVARRLAGFLKNEGVPVLLADTNWANVAAARVEGLNAYYGSLLSDHSDDELKLSGIGRLLALTSNDEANALTALKYTRVFGSQNVFQLAPGRSGSDRGRLSVEQGGRIIFHRPVTFDELEHLFEQGGKIKKTDITEQFDLEDFEQLYGQDYLAMFVIENGKIRVLTQGSSLPEAGGTLVSLVLEPTPAPEAPEVPAPTS